MMLFEPRKYDVASDLVSLNGELGTESWKGEAAYCEGSRVESQEPHSEESPKSRIAHVEDEVFLECRFVW